MIGYGSVAFSHTCAVLQALQPFLMCSCPVLKCFPGCPLLSRAPASPALHTRCRGGPNNTTHFITCHTLDTLVTLVKSVRTVNTAHQPTPGMSRSPDCNWNFVKEIWVFVGATRAAARGPCWTVQHDSVSSGQASEQGHAGEASRVATFCGAMGVFVQL